MRCSKAFVGLDTLPTIYFKGSLNIVGKTRVAVLFFLKWTLNHLADRAKILQSYSDIFCTTFGKPQMDGLVGQVRQL